MIGDQHGPLRARQLAGHRADRPVRADGAAGAEPAEHVGAGIDRVGQDAQHPRVGQPAELQPPGPRTAVGAAGKPSLGEAGHHLVCRTGRGERGEYVRDRRRDLLVRIPDHLPFVVVDVADRQWGAQFPAFGRSAFGALQPAGQQVQLGLAHRSLQAEQQPVVELGQVVDTVGVDDQRVGQPGVLQQPGQIGRGAGQPGHLQPEDRADLAQTDPRYQPLEPVPARHRPARHAQVRVDHLDCRRGPAQPRRLLRQRVLPGGRLGVLAHLRHRRLPDVDQRRPLQMLAAHLALAPHHTPPPPHSIPIRRRPARLPRLPHCARRRQPPRRRACSPPARPARRTAARRSSTPAPAGPAAPG